MNPEYSNIYSSIYLFEVFVFHTTLKNREAKACGHHMI